VSEELAEAGSTAANSPRRLAVKMLSAKSVNCSGVPAATRSARVGEVSACTVYDTGPSAGSRTSPV